MSTVYNLILKMDKIKKKIEMIYNVSKVNKAYAPMVEAHMKWEMSDGELIFSYDQVYSNAFRESFNSLSNVLDESKEFARQREANKERGESTLETP